ncbi:MAG: hypothetical protein FWG18_01585 [Alphaproteobacteria bacterium]|nr:hypothetical protein [Alphaproteobacteria bacterium]
MARRNPLTEDQKKRLKELLIASRAAGLPMSSISEFPDNIVKYWNDIWFGSKENHVYTEDEEKRLKKLLRAGKRAGKSITAVAREIAEDFPMHIVLYYNKKWKIFPIVKRRRYKETEKQKILETAATDGVMNASRKHGTNDVNIAEWNDKNQTYAPKEYILPTPIEERKEILQEVVEHNIKTGTKDGLKVVSAKYNKHINTLYTWDMDLGIVNAEHKSRKRQITPAAIQRVKKLLNEPGAKASPVARDTGHSKATVGDIAKELKDVKVY